MFFCHLNITEMTAETTAVQKAIVVCESPRPILPSYHNCA